MQPGSLAYKIFIDRFALKDLTRTNLRVGDMVVVHTNPGSHIAYVSELQSNNQVVVKMSDGSLGMYHVDQVDKPVETTYDECCARVSNHVAKGDSTLAFKFKEIMAQRKFVPAGRILAGAGSGQDTTWSNCFVISSPKDSREGIYDSCKEWSEIMSRGGGVGANFSTLRPKGALVKGVNGRSSGSVSWMEMFSLATKTITQGGCMHKDSLVHTSRGLIKITDVLVGDLVNTEEGYQPVTTVFNNGIKDLYAVTLSNGKIIRCTLEHKMLVMDKVSGNFSKKPLGEVTDTDLLCYSIDGSDYKTEQYVQLQTIEQPNRSTATVWEFPTCMTEDLAYFIGYFYGNGSCGNYDGHRRFCLAVPTSRPEVVKKLKDIFVRLFGKELLEYQNKGNWVNLKIGSIHLYDWLKHNGLLKGQSNELSFPESILKSPNGVQLAYIAGYFDADGCDRGTKGGYGFDSVDLLFLQSIQSVLSYNGIYSKVAKGVKNKSHWQDIYRLVVTGPHKSVFYSKLVEHSLKISKSPGMCGDNTIKYPGSLIHGLGVPSKYTTKIWCRRSENISRSALSKVIETLPETDYRRDTLSMVLKFAPVTIDKVEYYSTEVVYDLEVDNTHTYVCDGVLVSNSRNGAGIVVLEDWHPDIIDFIKVKRDMTKLTGLNISVAVSDKFMQAVEDDRDWHLIFPDTQHPTYDETWDGVISKWVDDGKPTITYGTHKARDIWDMICTSAWMCAEPGLFFIERYNYESNSWYFNRIISPNPCGEIGLPSSGICNLGHINLVKFVCNDVYQFHDGPPPSKEQYRYLIDIEGLRSCVQLAVEFLDNCLDLSYQPFDNIKARIKEERRIGLGTLGLGELLIRLGIRYGSAEAVDFCDWLYSNIAEAAYTKSCHMATELGSFDAFDGGEHYKSGFMQTHPNIADRVAKTGVRNVCLLTQAPTGTVGTMMETSTGVEPYFSFVWERTSRIGVDIEKATVVSDYEKATGKTITPSNYKTELPSYFVNAMDGSISVDDHINMQAVIQKHVDQSISKTINVPESYTVEQIKEAYMKLYTSGCKGGTVYRDNSRNEQVLRAVEPKKEVVKVEVKPEIKKRPRVRDAKMISVNTAIGTAHVTLTFDSENTPLEVFVEVGKGGSDVKAFSEAFGRLISLLLRIPSTSSPQERLEEVVRQLKDIGGARPLGFGKNKSKSLPDSIAKALSELSQLVNEKVLTEEAHPDTMTPNSVVNADMCPSCGDVTLIQTEGCCSCLNCGHSEC